MTKPAKEVKASAPITGRQLLEGIYSKFKKMGREIELPNPVVVEIANDSDWHRAKVGYSQYTSFVIVDIEGTNYLVALGETCGQYPAAPYDKDLVINKIATDSKTDDELIKLAEQILRLNYYFGITSLMVFTNGEIGARGETPLGIDRDQLKEIIKDNIAQNIEFIPGILTMDLRLVTKKEPLYRPKLVEVLFQLFVSHIKPSI